MYIWALTVTSVQVCTASSSLRETAASSLCIPSVSCEPLHSHVPPLTSRPHRPRWCDSGDPHRFRKTDVNLILPVCSSETHRSSPPTLRSLSDNCPDFEWHQSQSSVTLILSRSRLRWTDGGWPIYTRASWSPTPPQARNIKLTAAYSEMCDRPGACRYSGLSSFYF